MPDNASTPTDSLEPIGNLAAGISRATQRGPAPVHLWDPPNCGDIGLAIGADGSWSYRGSPIARVGLVKLFASVLRYDEDGQHYLVTPVEKIAIDVEDAPFLAVEMRLQGDGSGQIMSLRTNLDDWIDVGSEHPLRFAVDLPDQAFKPYVLVRGRLEARLTRALVYDLIELAVSGEGPDSAVPGVWSGDVFFPLSPEKQAKHPQ